MPNNARGVNRDISENGTAWDQIRRERKVRKSTGERDSVSQHIAEAISIEQAQTDDLHRLKTAEKRLLALTKLKLRKED
jgi:hypothetical protein